MLTTTLKDHGHALNMGLQRSAYLLKAAPFYLPGQRVARRYTLSGVLTTLSPKYRRAAPALLESAQDDGDMFVGLSLKDGDDLGNWFCQDSVMEERLRYVRNQFFNSLAETVKSSVWFADVESLRSLLTLATPTIRFVVDGNKSALPNWGQYVQAFAIVHNTRSLEEFKLAA